ncbi:hypothetical protein E1A91_A13G035600v1, partial [Gossypium mustelinum]
KKICFGFQLQSPGNSRHILTFAFALLVCLSVHGEIAQKPQKWIGEPSSDSEESFVNVMRSDFRADFVFGASTAAAQIEGSEKSKGKRPTVWDQFIRKLPDKIVDNSSLEVAIDLHNCYKV